MKKISSLFISLILVFGLTVTANGTLIDRGGGLIYDNDLDITWMANANDNGRMWWGEALDWADQLSYYDFVRNVYWNDWRLPSSLNQDWTGPCGPGFNCTGSEMGHLYYTELVSPLTNTGDFTNLQPDGYWSSTDLGPSAPSYAWYFNFNDGFQGSDYKNSPDLNSSGLFALAVRDGDVAAVPEPSTLILFTSGLIGMAVLRIRHIKRIM